MGRLGALIVLCWSLRAVAAPDVLECTAVDDEGKKDRKVRAGEHYRRGQELYAGGEYEAAIPEFRAAYCLLPAAEAVYNIAQAYERLVEYEKAVAWFDAYLRILPKGHREEAVAVENRLKVLRRLPARIRVATDPPGARIRIEGPSGNADGEANGEPLRVAAGTYTMRLELPGFIPVTETVVAEIGQPYTYSYRMSPQTGTLRVAARPSEARILVDDRAVGSGAYVDRVPVGAHEITIEAPLRPTEKRQVTVTADKETRLAVQLKPARPRNGKIELLIASSAFGIIEGGVIVASLTSNRPAIGAVALGSGALGFLAPMLLLPREVPTGQTSLMIGGRVWGATEGLGLASLLYDQPFDDHLVATSFLISGGSILVGVGAGVIGSRFDVSAGEAALVNSGAFWGSTTAGLLVNSLDADDSAGPLVLTGVNLGLLVGIGLASKLEPSRAHVFLIDLSGVAGIVSGMALSALLDKTENASTYALGGMAVGLIVGAVVTKNVDEDIDAVPFATVTERGTAIVGFAGSF